MSLDTLRIARELRDAEVAPAQAEAIAAAIGNAVNDGSATKGDIEALLAKLDMIEGRIGSRIESLDARFQSLETIVTASTEALEHRLLAKIEAMRSSILVWLIGIVIAAAGLLVTIGRAYF